MDDGLPLRTAVDVLNMGVTCLIWEGLLPLPGMGRIFGRRPLQIHYGP
jgi:hypothetical protein